MGQAYHRKGSLAFRPRKRANSQMPRINFWPASTDKRLLGFAGYKAGMTHYTYIDDSNSPNKGNEVTSAGTIVEVPPMMVFGIRGMKKGKCVGDMIVSDEKILREMGMKQQKKNELKSDSVEDVFVLAYARPKMCNFGKKRIEKMEIAVGGKDAAEKLEYAKTLIGKEVKFADVFKIGEYLDCVLITTGKGWAGTVKRFGTSVQRRKATGKRRHIGTLGAWHPGYVQYTVPRPGQLGYNKRTELNRRVVKIGGVDLNPKGDFPHYGKLQTDSVLMAGSIGGPVKRLIRFRKATRKTEMKVPDVKYISVESKQ